MGGQRDHTCWQRSSVMKLWLLDHIADTHQPAVVTYTISLKMTVAGCLGGKSHSPLGMRPLGCYHAIVGGYAPMSIWEVLHRLRKLLVTKDQKSWGLESYRIDGLRKSWKWRMDMITKHCNIWDFLCIKYYLRDLYILYHVYTIYKFIIWF